MGFGPPKGAKKDHLRKGLFAECDGASHKSCPATAACVCLTFGGFFLGF